MKKYLLGLLASLLIFGGVVITRADDTDTDTDGDGHIDNVDACQESDLSPTVVIDGCDSKVVNTVDDNGCTISDRIMECEDGAENHGEFVSCVAHLTNELISEGLTDVEKGAIQSCAAQSGIGALGQNRHRARYDLGENVLVIPCLQFSNGQYFAVDMNLTSATSQNFHFKVKKAELMTQTAVSGNEDPQDICAQYDLDLNSLTFPSLEIDEKHWQVQMKLLAVNSVNFHFKLEGIREIP